MQRSAYHHSLSGFLEDSEHEILGALTAASDFAVTELQRNAWIAEIRHLQTVLPDLLRAGCHGAVHLEYAIPRMGRRIDAVLILNGIVFVLEYKVDETSYPAHAYDQVTDYALDLKNFHEGSHEAVIAPILIATAAGQPGANKLGESKDDRVLRALGVNATGLRDAITAVLAHYPDERLDPSVWAAGRYQPTPTIIEAAQALYAGHRVQDLSRSDAGAINLKETSEQLERIIAESRQLRRKAICFVTGVPGAGKTLVGLNIATRHFDKREDLYSVFLSGNGPLVRVLHEALARDRVEQFKAKGGKLTKGEALSEVKAFIQNVHHFRDEGLKSPQAPVERIALFDEAQRAWDREQTAQFMKQKKGVASFDQSEPGFLISCMDRHPDWAEIVCLVGGGQEINSGEAGIAGWLQAIRDDYPDWQVFAAPNLTEAEYQADQILQSMHGQGRVQYRPELHLSVSMRSFRAEHVSRWVKALLDGELQTARTLYQSFSPHYPVVVTRSLQTAKAWVRSQARGSERYGLIVSSQAERLKPHAIDVRPQIDPVHWFLNGKDDVRSSYYLEDVATEFQVQGLELDWTCVAWDGDFRYSHDGWRHFSFRGSRWQHVRDKQRQRYQLNAYRVLLTRARQGMAIVIPEGDRNDPTRDPSYYDTTFEYLKTCGIQAL